VVSVKKTSAKVESGSTRLWDKGQTLEPHVHLFTVGRDPELDAILTAFDAVASAAHARMLLKIGILSSQECKELLLELKNIYTESSAGEFIILPELEDCHTAIEVRLVERLGDVGKKIHTGRSRNDQVLVAMRLFLRANITKNINALISLATTIYDRAANEVHTVMPGYTHTQRAMPTTAGMLLLSYSEYVLTLINDGFSAYRRINWNPLGVGSGFGVPLELDRTVTTTLLGFDRIQQNPIFVQSTRGREELKLLTWLVDIASCIEKCASDLILFSTEEFGFVKLPLQFTTGSSIMPQKRNPDVLELLRAHASKQRAARYEVEGITSKLISSYHRDFQYTKEPVFKACDLAEQSLSITNALFKNIEFVPDKMLQALTPDLFATHYAYELTSNGIPFRDAYKKAAQDLSDNKINVSDFVESFQKQESLRGIALLEEGKARLTAARNIADHTGALLQNVLDSIFVLEDE
jgi:argininosuccinate lyase